MKKDKKRKLIAMKVLTILLLAFSLAGVSLACTAYAGGMQQRTVTTVVYEEVNGGLEQIERYTKSVSPKEIQKEIKRTRNE